MAFILLGYVGDENNRPGEVRVHDSELVLPAVPKPGETVQYMHPWCPFAKRAKDGQIVHLPIAEQMKRPNQRCANPSCPGHGGKFPEPCRGW